MGWPGPLLIHLGVLGGSGGFYRSRGGSLPLPRPYGRPSRVALKVFGSPLPTMGGSGGVIYIGPLGRNCKRACDRPLAIAPLELLGERARGTFNKNRLWGLKPAGFWMPLAPLPPSGPRSVSLRGYAPSSA